MKIETLTARIQAAATQSTEALSDCLMSLAVDPPNVEAERNEPTDIALLRLLDGRDFAGLRTQFYSALAFGATVWDLSRADRSAIFFVASLFRDFSSPAVATSLASRLLAPRRSSTALRGAGDFDDIFIDALLHSASDITIRNRLVDLISHPDYRRFSIVVFYQLVRYDLKVVPLTIESVLSVAETQMREMDPFSSYILGFDSHLTPADVEGILNLLSPSQTVRFSEAFLSFSRRYCVEPDEVRDVSFKGDVKPGRTSVELLWDSTSGASIALRHPKSVLEGTKLAFEKYRDSFLQPVFLEGLTTKSMAAE